MDYSDFSWTYDGYTTDGYDNEETYTTTLQRDTLDDLNFDAEDYTALFAGFAGIFGIIMLFTFALAVLIIVANWKIFKKAGRNGWEAIIPVYNTWVLYEIVGLKGWYALLAFVPAVGGIIAFVFSIMAAIRLAKAFGKEGGFAVGLILLPVVFYPILGFGNDVYYGVDENGNTLSGGQAFNGQYGQNPQYGPTPEQQNDQNGPTYPNQQ